MFKTGWIYTKSNNNDEFTWIILYENSVNSMQNSDYNLK